MPTSLAHIHCRMRLDAPAASRNVAVFAAHLATSCRFCHPPCRFLPLLPPITPNVKFLQAANRLEFGIREETILDTRPKSGKNGNVHQFSQHCRNSLSPRSPLALLPSSSVNLRCLHSSVFVLVSLCPPRPLCPP